MVPSIMIILTNDYRNNNKLLYLKVKTHDIIEKNLLSEREIELDGNCFFRNISFFFTKKEDYHLFFREALCKYSIGLSYREV